MASAPVRFTVQGSLVSLELVISFGYKHILNRYKNK